jgi:uncharacterized protein (DUF4213/DUF364 family)
MKKNWHGNILEDARMQISDIANKRDLLQADVTVFAKPLTPEEAIGNPGRRDFPIIIGKERVIEATVMGSKGHAYTDSPQEFTGTLQQVLALELTSNQHRAIFVATLNAFMGHLGMATKTVHCKDEEPEDCALEIADTIFKRHGHLNVGLIGLNPAIAERLVDTFGPDHVRFTDLSRDNVGQRKFGVEIWDGFTRTDELIDVSDMIVFTGTTLINDTFSDIFDRIEAQGKKYMVYGVTAAGISKLFGIERICPRGREA